MATKKYTELQEFNDENLQAELEATKVQYQKLRYDHAVNGIENPLQIRTIRRDIARINSEIRRRELSSMSESDIAKRSNIRRRRK